MKRIVSIILTLVMMLSLTAVLPTSVSAYDTDNMRYIDGCKVWDLSDATYARIARIISRECGGGLYESRLAASHMANLFEENNVKSESGAVSFLDGGWYAGGNAPDPATDDAWMAMVEVFQNGRRYLPRYVTEYDGFCELYQNYGGATFYIGGKTAGSASEARSICENARPHEDWVKGPWGGSGWFYCQYNDGINGNIFYYNPDGPLFAKYSDDNYVFEPERFGTGTQQPEPTPEPVITEEPVIDMSVKVFIYETLKWVKGNNIYELPFIANDRTYLPLRVTAEAMNCKIMFNDSTKMAYFTAEDGTLLKFQIGSKIFTCNGTEIEMDVEPMIRNDRMFVPIRYIAESLGYYVTWYPEAKQVTLSKEPL